MGERLGSSKKVMATGNLPRHSFRRIPPPMKRLLADCTPRVLNPSLHSRTISSPSQHAPSPSPLRFLRESSAYEGHSDRRCPRLHHLMTLASNAVPPNRAHQNPGTQRRPQKSKNSSQVPLPSIHPPEDAHKTLRPAEQFTIRSTTRENDRRRGSARCLGLNTSAGLNVTGAAKYISHLTEAAISVWGETKGWTFSPSARHARELYNTHVYATGLVRGNGLLLQRFASEHHIEWNINSSVPLLYGSHVHNAKFSSRSCPDAKHEIVSLYTPLARFSTGLRGMRNSPNGRKADAVRQPSTTLQTDANRPYLRREPSIFRFERLQLPTGFSRLQSAKPSI